MKQENQKQSIPTWQQKGFSSKEHFAGFLYMNGLVHSSDGNQYVSVNDNNEAIQLFEEKE